MRHIRTLHLIVLGLAAVGCGKQNTPSSVNPTAAAMEQLTTSDVDVITDAAFEAVIAEKEFTDRSKAPECLALRGEINVLRPALLAKSEWISMVKTQAWQKLTDDYDAYIAAKCPPITLPATEITESCNASRSSLIQAWSSVHASPEYQVVDKHEALTSLVDKWNRAKVADCIAP